MNVLQASKIWLDYHRAHSKKNTVRAYEFTIEKQIAKHLSEAFVSSHVLLSGCVPTCR